MQTHKEDKKQDSPFSAAETEKMEIEKERKSERERERQKKIVFILTLCLRLLMKERLWDFFIPSLEFWKTQTQHIIIISQIIKKMHNTQNEMFNKMSKLLFSC